MDRFAKALNNFDNTFPHFAGYIPSIVKELQQVLDPKEYCLIGGLAISIVTSGQRSSSGDLDFLITDEGMKKLKNHWKGWTPIRYGWTLSWNGIDIDFLLPKNAVEQMAITNSTTIETVPVASPEYLFLMKYLVSREKDLNDLVWLYKSSPEIEKKVKELTKKIAPEEMDDIEGTLAEVSILAGM